MVLIITDRTKQTTTTEGTGTLDLIAPPTGFQSFVAAGLDSHTCYYTIVLADEWEVGLGTVTDAATDTLSRDTVLDSSNAGSLVVFSAGTKNVFVDIPASKVGMLDIASTWGARQTIAGIDLTSDLDVGTSKIHTTTVDGQILIDGNNDGNVTINLDTVVAKFEIEVAGSPFFDIGWSGGKPLLRGDILSSLRTQISGCDYPLDSVIVPTGGEFTFQKVIPIKLTGSAARIQFTSTSTDVGFNFGATPDNSLTRNSAGVLKYDGAILASLFWLGTSAVNTTSPYIYNNDSGNLGIATPDGKDIILLEKDGTTANTTAQIKNVITPVADTDASNKAYVDGIVGTKNLTDLSDVNLNSTFNRVHIHWDESAGEWKDDVLITSDMLINAAGTEVISGGVMTIDVDTTKFDMTAYHGIFVDNFTDPDIPTVTHVSFTARNALTVTNLVADFRTHVGIRLDNVVPSGGSATAITDAVVNGVTSQTVYLVQSPISYTPTEKRVITHLGQLVHPASVIAVTVPIIQFNASPALQLTDLTYALGPLNISGNVYSANGANLNINKTAGQSFREGINIDGTSAGYKRPDISDDSSDTALTFRYRYQDGTGGISEDGDDTTINPDLYDDGDGTLGNVTTNDWTIQSFWMFPGSAVTRIMYGQVLYNSISEAESGIINGAITDPSLVEDAILRGWLLVKEGTTDLSNSSQAKFISASKFVGIGGAGSATGEINTASNVGTDGLGVFKQKTGVDLEFKNIAPASSKLSVVANGDDIDLDVVPGNINTADLNDDGTFQAQGDVLDDLNTLGANAADSEFLVGTGAGALDWESGDTVRTSLGLAIGTDVLPNTGVGLVDIIPVAIDTGANGTVTIVLYAYYAFDINLARFKTASGDIDMDVEIDGVGVTSMTGLDVNSTEGNATATGLNSVAVGETVTLVFTNNSTAIGISVTIQITRT